MYRAANEQCFGEPPVMGFPVAGGGTGKGEAACNAVMPQRNGRRACGTARAKSEGWIRQGSLLRSIWMKEVGCRASEEAKGRETWSMAQDSDWLA